MIADGPAPECFAAFASASAATKYAAASTWRGGPLVERDDRPWWAARSGRRATRAPPPARGRRAPAGRRRARGRAARAAPRPTPARASARSCWAPAGSVWNFCSAIPRLMPSATRRACAPSWRLRSIWRSSSSLASTAPARVVSSVSTRCASRRRRSRSGRARRGVPRAGTSPRQDPDRPEVAPARHRPDQHEEREQRGQHPRVDRERPSRPAEGGEAARRRARPRRGSRGRARAGGSPTPARSSRRSVAAQITTSVETSPPEKAAWSASARRLALPCAPGAPSRGVGRRRRAHRAAMRPARARRPNSRASHAATTSPAMPAGTITNERARVSTCHEPKWRSDQRYQAGRNAAPPAAAISDSSPTASAKPSVMRTTR